MGLCCLLAEAWDRICDANKWLLFIVNNCWPYSDSMLYVLDIQDAVLLLIPPYFVSCVPKGPNTNFDFDFLYGFKQQARRVIEMMYIPTMFDLAGNVGSKLQACPRRITKQFTLTSTSTRGTYAQSTTTSTPPNRGNPQAASPLTPPINRDDTIASN